MNASFQWLQDFVDIDLTPNQVRDLITARVATVEDVIALRADLADIVVGRVVEKQPHPDSDHLNLIKVDAGTGELLDVVCGAPNVVVGTLYPFAPVGATLPGGLKIEKRKIRGQTSAGMLCSARELGLGDDHMGIMPLELNVVPGTPFLQAMLVGDTQLVVDVLPNRPDLLSHEGVAREIGAAAVGGVRPIRNPIDAYLPLPMMSGGQDRVIAGQRVEREGETDGVRIRVDAPDLCPKYCAYVIRGVTVGPSPEWLRTRLESIGVRSISNVVDATNYMLHGFGQPMHAFDAKKLAGQTVILRPATDGEMVRTLDGTERKLQAGMLVIADAERPQAIAGVMGGTTSEVDESTTDIVLEVALFDPRSVRRTRRALGVSTDASYRFERAMDMQRVEEFAWYGAQLIAAIAGGTMTGEPVVIGAAGAGDLHAGATRPFIVLRAERVAQLLGDRVPVDECQRLLRSVGFAVDAHTVGSLQVRSPSWRADVTIEADLIEEIARLQGYDTFSNVLRPFRVGTVPDAPSYVVSQRVTEALVTAGMYEVRPLPFVADAGEHGVRIRNPLAENEGMLRSSVLTTLARRVEHNFSHMVRDIRLFEVGVAFARGDSAIPAERTCAAAVMTGSRHPRHFTDAKPAQIDLWDAKWIAQVIGDTAFGRDRMTLVPDGNGQRWQAMLDGQSIGAVGPIELDAPVWASPVYGIEIDITPAFGTVPAVPRYVPLPTTPASEFDLALLVPEVVSAADVERVVREAAGELLESLSPFDEFRGQGVAEGSRSVAWRLTLRHPERTLRDKEIEGRRDKILRTLDHELGVRPRVS